MPDVAAPSQGPPGVRPLSWQDPSGEMGLNFHSGQLRAWDSQARVVLVLAGAQSGKTSFGPFWLAREIQRKGPGDYIVAAPTYKLLSLKLFPEFLRLFKVACRWGDFTGRGSFQNRFLFNAHGCRALFGRVPAEPTQVFFGHAQDPDSLESATGKAAWLDEAGQKKFRLGSWEAVNRRLAIHQGRVLITTTPYTLGWLKDLVFDPWRREKAAGRRHPHIEVVNFKSVENPAFPREEYERAREAMPSWKFRMFYDGIFERPAGSIYSDFDTSRHVTRQFPVPDDWPRYMGLDFGGVHTAGVLLAAEKSDQGQETGRLFLYREYPERARWASATAKGHALALKAGEPRMPRAVGGAASEDQWREEFRVAGLPVTEPPIKDVEPGIDRVIAAIKRDELVVFDTCTGVLDDLQNYSRELDDQGNPTEKIEDKEDYHYADALRYVISYVKGVKKVFWMNM